MDIKIKPIKIKLRQKGDAILVETPFAKVKVKDSAFAFITQGLAYQYKRVELDAPPKLAKRFNEMFQMQMCLSHLSEFVSPFLANYLANKAGGHRPNRLKFESLIDELKGTERVLFCGAGPSLYQTWDFVRFCLETGYARVVAGGSAIKAFANEGIVPDLCLTCDPNPGVASRGDLPATFTSETLLLAGSGTHPGLLKNWIGGQVLTNGLSSLPMGDYLEPGRVTVSEGGIGVSTFIFHLCDLVQPKELLLLGVDLGSTNDGKLYPDSLGFDNKIDNHREEIWSCEALHLGKLAKSVNYSVKNLAENGRNIPNTAKIRPNLEELVPQTPLIKPKKLKPDFEDGQGAVDTRIRNMYKDLCEIDLNDVGKSPLFKPLIELYHNIYTSRMLYTGEYPRDSMVLRLEYLKGYLESLYPTR